MGVKIFNLEKSRYETERVCAEGAMNFIYGTRLGALSAFALFSRAFFSRLGGLWADSPRSRKAIARFAADNNIDVSEFKNPPASFRTFNDFFTRELADGARPLARPGDPRAVSFPCDGRHLLARNVSAADVFYAKGSRFDLAKFLGDPKLAARFEGGSMLISRLSPVDYHRFHYPFSGEIAARKLVKGPLYSVSPLALSRRLSILWENKRVLNLIDSEALGLCAFVEIGATNVGSIENFGAIGARVERGEQAGLFRFGGSCVVSVFPPEANIDWNEVLAEKSAEGVECYARVNTLAGRAR